MKTHIALLLCAWVLWDHTKFLDPPSKVEPDGSWSIVGVATTLDECSKLLDKTVKNSTWLKEAQITTMNDTGAVRSYISTGGRGGSSLRSVKLLCLPGTLDPRLREVRQSE